MAETDVRLREEMHLFGELSGQTIRTQRSDDFLDKIERTRKSAKAKQRDSTADAELLISILGDRDDSPNVTANTPRELLFAQVGHNAELDRALFKVLTINAPQNMAYLGTETFNAKQFVKVGIIVTIVDYLLMGMMYWCCLGRCQERAS